MRVWASLVVLGAALSFASADEERTAFTSYESGPLSEANLVVVGRTVELSSKRAQQIAWVQIDRVLLGAVHPNRRLLVYGHGPHPATSVADPMDSYFPSPARGRHVFFLGSRDGSVGAVFQDAFEAEGIEGDEKIQAIAQEIELAQVEPEAERAAQTRAYLMDGLRAKGLWTRVHAARELRRFAAAGPQYVTREMEGVIRALARRSLPKDMRAQIQKLVLELDRRAVDGVTPEASRVEGKWQRAFRDASPDERAEMIDVLFASGAGSRALAAAWWAFEEGDAGIRAQVVRHTANARARSRLETTLSAYADEPEVYVRREMVRAVGLLGSAEQVAWLAERSANPRLMRAAWLGLARIRTTEALDVLNRAAASLEDGGDEDRRTAKWLRFLVSDAFPASDRGR